MRRLPLYFAAFLVPLGLLLLVRSLEAGEARRIEDIARRISLADQAGEQGHRAADQQLRGDTARALGGALRQRAARRNGGALLILAGMIGLALHHWGVTGASLALAGSAVIALAFLMLGPLRVYEGLRRGVDPHRTSFIEEELRAVSLHEASLPLLAATTGGAVAVALSRAARGPAYAGRARAALVLGAVCLGASGLVWALYGGGILREVL